MGRPRSNRQSIVWNVKLVLHSPEDDDLIALRERLVNGRNGARVIKTAIRSGASLLGEDSDTQSDDEMADALSGLIL